MVDAAAFAEALKLTVLSPSTRKEWDISLAEFNRPGLEFVGYYDYFAYERPQVIGKGEMTFLESLSESDRNERLSKFFSYPIPCLIICRGMTPPKDLLEMAGAKDIAVLQSQISTTQFIVDAILYLSRVLAPSTTMHAVLVNVYGVGILITGESGVGKSEAALELIKRGHQLVADDVVEIRRVTNNRLIGTAPQTVRHFMEIRGIGIINIRAMYGISSVMMNTAIDLEVHLETWKDQKEYDRLGLDEETTAIMGVSIPHLVMPVKPGRNLAIIIEVAARNYGLKQMGYSAAWELDRRLNEMMGIKE
ncbi:MAG: HPr(Ser) kinase/phosphatase [Clostridiales bacterium]|nr:HPr(Ser) kinase/phosphatase [Clostridiales bacterium]